MLSLKNNAMKLLPILFKQSVISLRSKHSWTLPTGYETSAKIYNCVTRRNEPLIVSNKDAVTWYTCGPTVYDSAHIGHASCYVRLDIIQRILKQHFGLNLITCMNITDIDDKILHRAGELKIDYRELSRKYEKEFWNDLHGLGIERPQLVLRVTENIPIVIGFIQEIIQQEAAYKASDNSVYFDISKSPFPPGRLQNISEESLDYSSSNPHKKSPADFALWKSAKCEDEPYFDSPWGKGRPGWHIECSALASNVFGSNIDIHAGGIDLRFPHHENEEIQSCVFYKKHQWVNHWLHTGHLHLKGSLKMSKSLKNTISIESLLKQTKAEVFRMACVRSRYSRPVEFNSDLLENAEKTLEGYKNFLLTINEVKEGVMKPSLDNNFLGELLIASAKDIHVALCDDFNTPQVIQILNNMVSKVNIMIHSSASASNNCREMHYLLGVSNLLHNCLSMFGIDLKEVKTATQSEDVSELIDLLVRFRQDVRNLGLVEKNGDILRLCDSLREQLKNQGLIIKDHGKISSWSR